MRRCLLILNLLIAFLPSSFSQSVEKETAYYPGGAIKQLFHYYLKDNQKVFHGKYIEYFTVNTPMRKISFKHGIPHGKYIEYYRSGEKKTEGSFSQGLRTGRWFFYDNRGVLKVKARFTGEGLKKWLIRYDIFGKKESREFYKHGVLWKRHFWDKAGYKHEKVLRNPDLISEKVVAEKTTDLNNRQFFD